MKNSQFADDRFWLKICLHLLACLFLILTPFLLARAQAQDSTKRTSRAEAGIDSETDTEGFLEAGFSTRNLFIFLGLAAISLIAVRKVRQLNGEETHSKTIPEKLELVTDTIKSTRLNENSSNDLHTPAKAISTGTVSIPASLYSAYRIEQNVLKLVSGERYNCEVLSSRAPDDRRAIEAFLNRVITSAASSLEEVVRARTAMETYGFVARHASSLLMAPEPFERTDAARSLGEIGSDRALPFLLEALYDVEPIVRNHAVVSLGHLGLPSAIGPLLERATRQPELSTTLVSRTLGACSIDIDGNIELESGVFMSGHATENYEFDIDALLSSSTVEDLPDDIDDEEFNKVLEAALSDDLEERCAAVKGLSQYPAKSVVDWLVTVSRDDRESIVRALAISSLAFIDHESVLPAVLVAMADESREVRAFAARAFSRLSFDRANAYLNICNASDEENLRAVASACLRAGIVTQNIDRLARYDRFQTSETFALICVLARAQLVDSVIDVILNHSVVKVRCAAVRLLASTRQPSLVERFEELTKTPDLPDEVASAVLEGLERLHQGHEAKVAEGVAEVSETTESTTPHQPVTEISLNEFVSSESDPTSIDLNTPQETPAPEQEKGIVLFAADGSADVRRRLNDPAAVERAGALADLARAGGDQAFDLIVGAFDDPSPVVRNAAARALFLLDSDVAVSFAMALRLATPQRRRNIGFAIASSGLASDALSDLHRRSISKTHESLALLFLMTRAGEIQPLLKAIEENVAIDTRITCVKLLALTGQFEVLPAFRRLSGRASLPADVRSVILESIYQLSMQNQNRNPSSPAA